MDYFEEPNNDEKIPEEDATPQDTESEEEYLKDCGRMMKDANNVLSKKIYKANAETIKQAKDASTGEIKESYERLIALYEGGDEQK